MSRKQKTILASVVLIVSGVVFIYTYNTSMNTLPPHIKHEAHFWEKAFGQPEKKKVKASDLTDIHAEPF